LSKQCAGIKPDGGRCRVIVAPPNEYCFAHDPTRAGERRRNARRAGKARTGTGEIRELKAELKTLKDDVLAGRVDRNDAAVVVQAYRCLKDFIELERRVKETDELMAEVEELKRAYGA
jgi:hypothetical protein